MNTNPKKTARRLLRQEIGWTKGEDLRYPISLRGWTVARIPCLAGCSKDSLPTFFRRLAQVVERNETSWLEHGRAFVVIGVEDGGSIPSSAAKV